MTKAELVTSIAEKTGLTKKDSEKALAAFVDTVTETLAFEVRERAAREGINPRTKEKIEIAATKVPAFKAGRALKDAVSE